MNSGGHELKGNIKKPSWWFLCRQFFYQLPVRRRWQLAGVFALTGFGVLAELATLGAILPFLTVLANPAAALRYPVIARVAAFFGWHNAADLLLPATTLFIAVALLSGATRTFLTWTNLKFTYGVGADAGRALYSQALYQPFSYHVSHNTSEIIASINQVNTLIHAFLNPMIQMTVSGVFSIAILIALILIDPWMAVSAGVGFVMIYAMATYLSRRRLAANSAVTATAEHARIQAIQEGLGGIRDVLIDGAQDIYVSRFVQYDTMQKNAIASNNFLAGLPRFLIESIGVVLIVIIAYGSTRNGTTMEAVIPGLGALALGAQRVMPNLQQIYFGWAALTGERIVIANLIEKLGIASREKRIVHPKPLSFQRSILLREVGYRYSPEGLEVIKNISLAIPRGSMIGFVGRTGGGKSTLLDLIMGLLAPTSGTISIDGDELVDVNRRAWQARIAHVPQAVYLSDTTLAENIAFGQSVHSLDLPKIREAADKAQISAFIESLPLKYDTTVGERGVRLSGGQRQRIGLARAFYKDASVLILDEATSALDDETEQAVMQAIRRVQENITVLMIAHRISTLKHCDQIYRLDNGAISQAGRFEELFPSH